MYYIIVLLYILYSFLQFLYYLYSIYFISAAMLGDIASTNKSLTSQARQAMTKNHSRNPFEDKKKKYRKKQKPLTQQQIQVFRQAFQIFDSNKSGTIDEQELTALMSALGYECTPQIIRQIMDQVDQDGSGVIQIDEFIQFMTKHMLDTENLRRQMTKVFNYFDDDGSGFLDNKKIRKMVSQCFYTIDDEAIEKMIESADTDGDGKINKYEFLRIMKKVKLL